MTDYVEILGIRINKYNMQEAVNFIDSLIQDGKKGLVVTPNSEMIVTARKDGELARILNRADLSVPDGAGVVLASRILRNPVPERVAGFDLMQETLALAGKKGYSVYLLGAEPGIVELASEKIKERYPGIKISGTHHGFLAEGAEELILAELNKLKPDILYVGMGVPRQEKFLDKHLKEMDVKLAMTVGGSFDVLAGKVRRAPLWMQRSGLEWLYRLIQEPQRIGRMMALPVFLLLVIKQYLKERFS
ncbi:MAG: WecB/TagA/CpsF family glycosyltransferase [Halanaerobiaceae bacterium]|nr:WecB/TagA/CpsF family glycosyltransferase [Halanaerobiaceae bacterium]